MLLEKWKKPLPRHHTWQPSPSRVRTPTVVATHKNQLSMSVGPCHPSAHGVFRLLIYMVLELVLWLDTCVGLLHRSTEYLCEHRYTTHIAGYLSRTDYVAHVQLETMAIHIATRFTSANRSVSSIMLHLSLLANHLLNVCCSLGDLGCISFIL